MVTFALLSVKRIDGMACLNAFFRFAKQVFYENMGKMLNDYLCNCDLTIVVGLIDFF